MGVVNIESEIAYEAFSDKPRNRPVGVSTCVVKPAGTNDFGDTRTEAQNWPSRGIQENLHKTGVNGIPVLRPKSGHD